MAITRHFGLRSEDRCTSRTLTAINYFRLFLRLVFYIIWLVLNIIYLLLLANRINKIWCYIFFCDILLWYLLNWYCEFEVEPLSDIKLIILKSLIIPIYIFLISLIIYSACISILCRFLIIFIYRWQHFKHVFCM